MLDYYNNENKQSIITFDAYNINPKYLLLNEITRPIAVDDRVSIIANIVNKDSLFEAQVEANNINVTRLDNTYNILMTLKALTTEYVLLLNAQDCLLCDDISDKLIKALDNAPYIISGMTERFPDINVECNKQLSLSGPSKFISSSVIFGRVTELITLFEAIEQFRLTHRDFAASCPSTIADLQFSLKYALYNSKAKIDKILDHENKFFSIMFAKTLQFRQMQKDRCDLVKCDDRFNLLNKLF